LIGIFVGGVTNLAFFMFKIDQIGTIGW